MGVIQRHDGPGVWHHVYHRGASQRTVFERRADLRFFLAQLAKAARRGELAIVAFVLLTNHFHLLVQSLVGRLSEAMKRILHAYVRYFNRTRGREGALFGGRFRSKPVFSMAYWRVLVAYIDENPIEAGLVERAEDYPWGSAFHYARPKGPIWLARSWIESEVGLGPDRSTYDPRVYAARFGRRLPKPVRQWVDRRLMGRSSASEAEESLDDLLAAAPDDLLAWMRWRARVADGSGAGSVGTASVPAEWVEETVRLESALDGAWTTPRGVTDRSSTGNGWHLVLAGLLRDLGGLGQRELALRLRLPRTTLQHRLQAHTEALRHDPAYAARCTGIARAVLDRIREL